MSNPASINQNERMGTGTVGAAVEIEYTRTCPALVPFPSFAGAPTATLVPSDDNDIERPNWSPAASPSISAPFWVHALPFHS